MSKGSKIDGVFNKCQPVVTKFPGSSQVITHPALHQVHNPLLYEKGSNERGDKAGHDDNTGENNYELCF
jgi:hypothetical protein